MVEPENAWWRQIDDILKEGKKCCKWWSLEHRGIIFPPDYRCHGVPLLYKVEGSKKGRKGSSNGKWIEIALPREVEELATFWCMNMGLENEKKPIFINNFWNEFRKAIEASGDHRLINTIVDFNSCDFSKMNSLIKAMRELTKALPKEEREVFKDEEKKMALPYQYCLIDGIKNKVGNCRVEPPGLFRGRGEHPKQGKLKERIMPEAVTLNTDPDLPPPICHRDQIYMEDMGSVSSI